MVDNHQLWVECMSRLKTDKHMLGRGDIDHIMGVIHPPKRIEHQMRSDLRVYPMWDALAMWVGVGGLVEYWPPIGKLVQAFLKEVPTSCGKNG